PSAARSRLRRSRASSSRSAASTTRSGSRGTRTSPRALCAPLKTRMRTAATRSVATTSASAVASLSRDLRPWTTARPSAYPASTRSTSAWRQSGHRSSPMLYSAAYLLHPTPPTAGWGIDDTDHDEAFASINGLGYPASQPYFINRAMNITYLTPRFSGFQAGVTFTPDQQNRENMNNRVVTNLSEQTAAGRLEADIDRDLQNIVGLGANYERSFDAFDLGLSAGVETGEWNHGAEQKIGRA